MQVGICGTEALSQMYCLLAVTLMRQNARAFLFSAPLHDFVLSLPPILKRVQLLTQLHHKPLGYPSTFLQLIPQVAFYPLKSLPFYHQPLPFYHLLPLKLIPSPYMYLLQLELLFIDFQPLLIHLPHFVIMLPPLLYFSTYYLYLYYPPTTSIYPPSTRHTCTFTSTSTSTSTLPSILPPTTLPTTPPPRPPFLLPTPHSTHLPFLPPTPTIPSTLLPLGW